MLILQKVKRKKRGTIISASIPKYVRGIDGCTTQAFPGATIARLADFVSNGRINLKNINFVIVHVGTNNVTDFYRKV